MTVGMAKTIFVVCVIAWYAIRYPHARRSRRIAVHASARGLRESILIAIAAVGLGIVPIVYATSRVLRFADYAFVPATAWVGWLIFIFALWVFYRTHRELGRNWSVSLDIREQHTLITTGIYARIRHPMYSA